VVFIFTKTHILVSYCNPLCNTWEAQVIEFVLTWRCPYLPTFITTAMFYSAVLQLLNIYSGYFSEIFNYKKIKQGFHSIVNLITSLQFPLTTAMQNLLIPPLLSKASRSFHKVDENNSSHCQGRNKLGLLPDFPCGFDEVLYHTNHMHTFWEYTYLSLVRLLVYLLITTHTFRCL